MTATLPLDTLDELTTPLLRLDAAGQVVDANLAAGRWLGVSRRRLLGTPAVALERDAQVWPMACAWPCTKATTPRCGCGGWRWPRPVAQSCILPISG